MSCIVDSLSNLVNSHIVEDEAWVCSCTFSTKSLMTFNLNCVSHYPFPSLIHSNGVSPFPKSFCFTYWYPLLINFLAPLSVKTNSMIASFNEITQTRTKTFHKNIAQCLFYLHIFQKKHMAKLIIFIELSFRSNLSEWFYK